MKKIFGLIFAMSCTGAFAVNPDSDLGREYMDGAMEECVETMMEQNITLGVASDYCKCIFTKALPNLSVDQITEYYNHGREIEAVMEQSAKECVKVLIADSESSAKDYIIKSNIAQCVQGAMASGAKLGIASEYCKCAVNKMFENLSIEQMAEYYNYGREIEDLASGAAKECVKLLVK